VFGISHGRLRKDINKRKLGVVMQESRPGMQHRIIDDDAHEHESWSCPAIYRLKCPLGMGGSPIATTFTGILQQYLA
jgi:hypothetical protein